MNKKQWVYVVRGRSESADEYGSLVFSKKPSEKKLKELCFSWDGDLEDPTGNGDYGSYVSITVEKVIVQ